MIKSSASTSAKEKNMRVAITHGDLNGISYEVIMKALKDNRMLELFTPVIYGLSRALSYHRKGLKINDFNYKVVPTSEAVIHKKVNIINLTEEEVKIEFGKSSSEAGKYAFLALERAVEDLKAGNMDILVTAPLNKFNIQSEHFDFPGHTEYLADRFESNNALMLMVKDNLRIGVATGHIPISKVSETLSIELILNKIEIINESLIRDFGINKPKIAVLGLNPHAGDNGVIGNEDQLVTIPAIEAAWNKDILAFGPFPADGFFGSSAYLKYDAILAMYHDQGLIPFKTIAFEGGVNFTAGLSIIRTSPAHGTAYDKAGKNGSSAVAMKEAIYLAIDIYRNRNKYKELVKNQLPTGMVQEFFNGKYQKDSNEIKRAEN